MAVHEDMIVIFGDLWSELGKADLLLVTANASVRSDDHLVMGRGAAREARDRFYGLSLDLGRVVQVVGSTVLGRRYGIVFAPYEHYEGTRLGIFQVKYHWRDRADLGLIRHSAGTLASIALDFRRIAMNYPGIGNGGLRIEYVQPIVDALPDNVYLYRKGTLGTAQQKP